MKFLLILPVVPCLFFTGACGGSFPFPPDFPSVEIPVEVQAVAERSSFFAQDNGHALLKVEPGTVIDDLSGLNRCWGGFASARQLGENYFEDIIEFQRFDVEGGTLVNQVYLRHDFGIDSVYLAEYDLEVTGNDRIRLIARGIEFRSAVFAPDVVVATPEELAEESPIELQVTLDGDRFSIADSLDAPDYLSSGLRLFRSFDCPNPDDVSAESSQ